MTDRPFPRAVAVTGSRTLPDNGAVERVLDELRPDLVIVGCCPTGADKYARRWSRVTRVKRRVLGAMWTEEGKPAGHIRNSQIIDTLVDKRDLGWDCHAIAFPEPHGTGTQNCTKQLERAGFSVRVFEVAR